MSEKLEAKDKETTEADTTRKVVLEIEDEGMADALEAAMKSGRFFMTISFLTPTDIKHCWLRQRMHKSDIVHCVKHLISDWGTKEKMNKAVQAAAKIEEGEEEEDITWK